MITIKSPHEIELMCAAGRVVAEALAAASALARPGARLADLDAAAHKLILQAGGRPVFLGYHPKFAPSPFPGTLCLSVNDEIVHGLPRELDLRDGDLLSIDCGVELDGWVGDAAVTVAVGEVDVGGRHLIDATREALAAAISCARPGGRLTDIGYAVTEVAARTGFGTIDDFGGHGIGRVMHEDPFVPNASPRRGRGPKLKVGMVLAIEPMLNDGPGEYVLRPDGWTVATADGSRAAHVEHTVAITADGPRVLTAAG